MGGSSSFHSDTKIGNFIIIIIIIIIESSALQTDRIVQPMTGACLRVVTMPSRQRCVPATLSRCPRSPPEPPSAAPSSGHCPYYSPSRLQTSSAHAHNMFSIILAMLKGQRSRSRGQRISVYLLTNGRLDKVKIHTQSTSNSFYHFKIRRSTMTVDVYLTDVL